MKKIVNRELNDLNTKTWLKKKPRSFNIFNICTTKFEQLKNISYKL